MTLRDRFEARYPCPEGVVYDESRGRYMPDFDNRTIDTYPDDGYRADIQNLRWSAYQAAIEDAVPCQMSEQEIKVLAMEIYMAVISGCNVQDIEEMLKSVHND